MTDPEISTRIDFNRRLEEFKKVQEKIRLTTPNEDGDINWDEISNNLPKQETKYLTLRELENIEFPPQQWIIDRFLPEGGITLLVGEAGTLKSYISVYIAKQLLLGEKLFGEFETFRKCKILLIDKENKLPRIQRRLIGLNTPPSDDMWIIKSPETFLLEDKGWVEDIKEFIKTKRIDIVIMDSFVDFFSGNENSSTDTALAFNAIRSFSPTVSYILIHHDSKPIPHITRTAAQRTRGSSNIIAQVDTQFYFEKGKDNLNLIIEQGKSRDEEPLAKFQIEIVSDEEKGVTDFIYKGLVKDELGKVEEAANFVMNFLALNPYQPRLLIIDEAERHNITKSSVERAIVMLKEKKLISSKAEGRKKIYFILEASDEADLENDSESQLFLQDSTPYIESDK